MHKPQFQIYRNMIILENTSFDDDIIYTLNGQFLIMN